MFTGSYELTIDDKNRLSIPASVRAHMEAAGYSSRLYLVPGEWKHTLALVPEKHFESWVARVRRPSDDPAAASRALFLSAASPCLEIDKHGRVLLPHTHLELAGIERQILLLGHYERWVLMNRQEANEFVRIFWASHQKELHAVVEDDPDVAGKLWQGFSQTLVEPGSE